MVEREHFGFPMEIVYENLPTQCGHCGLFGHETTKCRRLPKQHKEQQPIPKSSTDGQRAKLIYMPIPKSNAIDNNISLGPATTHTPRTQVEWFLLLLL